MCERGGNETEKKERENGKKEKRHLTGLAAGLVGSFGREGREFLSVVELIAVSIAA